VSESSITGSYSHEEAEDWRCSLRFFESALQYLTARQAEMAIDPAQWNQEMFQANADLVASALRGAEIARRNLARIEMAGGASANPQV